MVGWSPRLRGWSRTARDDEWWTTCLDTEKATRSAAPAEPPAAPALPAPACR
ncbi:hypothetical protein GTW37_35090 [Streptomyces sp. SID4931]|nr:hypothetical protein [Streptomyces sp. SID4931]SCG08428.1 hypothetical protein GA0115255_124002 [Streptomyces sp. Ncost-T6T-2b]